MKGTAYTLHAQGVRQQAARGGRVRRFPLLGRFALCFFLAFALICQPYILAFEGWQVKAHKQEAYAVPAAIPVAYAFLEAAAAAAGLSVSDFLVTVAIGTSAVTGASIVSSNAQYGADSADMMLTKVISTADWPRYDDLTDDQKTQFGSASNYYAQQWNNYLGCVGLGDARDQYYGTGGGDFDEGAQSKLERLGEIGNRWKNGEMVPVTQLIGLEPVAYDFVNPSTGRKVYRDYGAGPITYTFISASDSNGYQIIGDEWYCGRVRGEGYTGNLGINDKWSVVTSRDGSLPVIKAQISSNGDSYVFSGSSTAYYYTMTANGITRGRSSNGLSAGGLSGNTIFTAANGYTLNVAYPNYDYTSLTLIDETVDGILPDGDFAPDEFPGDYVGSDDIGPDKSWPSLFSDELPTPPTPTPDPGYPESDFNPDVGDDGGDYVPETSTPEWQQKTQDQIFKPVLNLPFDKMFPFCVIWDISLLMNKLYEVGGYQAVSADQSTSLRSLYAERDGLKVQANEESKGGSRGFDGNKPAWTAGHTEIILPLRNFSVNGMDELEIDVWPLAVLLQWLKPFLQLAFIAGLLFVTVVTFRMFIFTD